jgi:hypothetical protein
MVICDSVDNDLTAALIAFVDIEIPIHASVSMTFCGVRADCKKILMILCSAFDFGLILCIMILIMMTFF